MSNPRALNKTLGVLIQRHAPSLAFSSWCCLHVSHSIKILDTYVFLVLGSLVEVRYG